MKFYIILKHNLNKLPKKFICSIGRPSYQKNTELLIKTIIKVKETIKDIHLVILGVGFYSPSLSKIENLIKENGLKKNITLIPWLNRAETMSILKNSLFYVSTSRYEGLPYAVIEALSLAKLCIVTNVDGNKDLIKNGYNGFLVNEKAPKIAEVIVKLYKNNSIIQPIELNARKEYQNKYDISKNIKALENNYLKLIES